MELKSMMPSNFGKLLWNNLKEKKNWFLLSLVILLVTVVVVPLLMERDLTEGNIMVGIFEVFLIVFVNCVIDYNYLHDSRKYGYYLSKPLTNIQRINVITISNVAFAMILIFPLWLVSFSQGFDLNQLFSIAIPWLIIGVFVAALSSVQAGNSIIGGVATIFNFALPVSILGVIYFALDIVENMALGFDSNILMNNFIENFYKIEYLYFFKFATEHNLPLLFALLIAICAILYMTTLWLIKRRKNERIGQPIVFTNYKNFVALLVSTLVPFMFSSALNNDDYVAKLLSFVILGSITYYVIIAILEKSFKLEKRAYKLLGAFMMTFVLFVLIAGSITRQFGSYIPDVENIEGALIFGYDTIYIDMVKDSIALGDLELSNDSYEGINIFGSNEAITAIRSIQESIIENQEYNYNSEVNIVYFLKDGRRINRWYQLKCYNNYLEDGIDRNVNSNPNIDLNALKLEMTEEYKSKALNFVYDDDFTKEWDKTKISVTHMFNDVVDLTIEEDELSGLREALRKDLEVIIDKESNSLMAVISQNMDFYIYNYFDKSVNEVVKEEQNVDDSNFNLKIESEDGYIREYNIPPNFSHTRDFIKELIMTKN